jgi:hypothetical protein
MRTSYSWSAASEPEVAAAGSDDVEERPQRGGREHDVGEGEREKVRRRSEDRRPRSQRQRRLVRARVHGTTQTKMSNIFGSEPLGTRRHARDPEPTKPGESSKWLQVLRNQIHKFGRWRKNVPMVLYQEEFQT